MNYRYSPLLLGLLVGLVIGILYGWVINPAESREISPQSLQDQYRTDLVLMIAEIFASEENPVIARQRLSNLGLESYEEVVTNALNYAKSHDFSDLDIDLLNDLAKQIDLSIIQSEASQP